MDGCGKVFLEGGGYGVSGCGEGGCGEVRLLCKLVGASCCGEVWFWMCGCSEVGLW